MAYINPELPRTQLRDKIHQTDFISPETQDISAIFEAIDIAIARSEKSIKAARSSLPYTSNNS